MDQTNSDLASALRFFKRLACLDGAEKDMCIAAFARHQTVTSWGDACEARTCAHWKSETGACNPLNNCFVFIERQWESLVARAHTSGQESYGGHT